MSAESAQLPSKPPVRIGEPQPLVLQVELSVAPPTHETLGQWVTIIEAVGSVAGQDVKIINVSPTVEIAPLETQIEQHFRAGLDYFQLTPLEQRITELLVIHGKTGPEIAKAVGMTQGYLRNVMSNVMRKTGSNGRAAIAFRVLGRHAYTGDAVRRDHYLR